MPEVGTRVALNFEVHDLDDAPVPKDAVGRVIGHMGDLEVVDLDHGVDYVGQRRVVIWAARAFRPVQVSHPGKARRSRPRSTK